VPTFLRATVLGVLSGLAFVVGPTTLGAAPQEPIAIAPVSLGRIRDKLQETPARALSLDLRWPQPVTTFKTSVDQRVFVPSLQEQLRKDFGLTLLQRQSADWASRCCGLSLNQLAAQVVRSVNKARQQRTLRKTREQIARELAELDAARKNDPRESK
jgi:hypothetical protein